MPSIIIVGSSTKSAAYTVKQLSRYGLDVTVYAWMKTPLKHSRYVRTFVQVPSPDRDVAAFANGLIRYLELHHTDCLLPINDQALEICKLYEKQLSLHTQVIGMNVPAAARYAHSKAALIEIAASTGVKAPKTILITTLDDLELYKDQIAYPCIAKAASSSIIKNNRLYYFKVRRFSTYPALLDYVRENINNINILIQETITGYGIGYNIIAKDGVVLNEYIHRRLFEYEGESTYRESVQVTEYGLREQVHRLIKAIGWTGVAMVEYRISTTGAYIMEINGRFWGSIEVAIRSGLNYPVQLYEMQYLNKEIVAGLPVRHVRVRNLKEEIVNTLRAVAHQRSPRPLFRWLATFKNTWRSNEFIEDNVFDDPGFVLACYADVISRNALRLLERLQLRSISPARHQAVVSAGSKAVIAFACTGNICRSPFAEYFARHYNPTHEYFSFGTVIAEGRQSPVNAVAAAAALGTDLSSFTSSVYDKGAIDRATHIFVMDRRNFADLCALGIDEKKIFFLGDEEIPDPYGKPIDTFSRIYGQIAAAIERKLPRS